MCSWMSKHFLIFLSFFCHLLITMYQALPAFYTASSEKLGLAMKQDYWFVNILAM